MIDSITSCIFWTYENSEMRQIIQEKQAQLTIYPIYGWCISMDVITSSIILLLHLQIHRICQLYRNWSIHKKLSFPLHTFAILVKLSYEAKISLVVLNKGIEWNGWQFCRFRIHIISLESVSSRRIYVISNSFELYKSFNKQWNSNGAQESHSWPFSCSEKKNRDSSSFSPSNAQKTVITESENFLHFLWFFVHQIHFSFLIIPLSLPLQNVLYCRKIHSETRQRLQTKSLQKLLRYDEKFTNVSISPSSSDQFLRLHPKALLHGQHHESSYSGHQFYLQCLCSCILICFPTASRYFSFSFESFNSPSYVHPFNYLLILFDSHEPCFFNLFSFPLSSLLSIATAEAAEENPAAAPKISLKKQVSIPEALQIMNLTRDTCTRTKLQEVFDSLLSTHHLYYRSLFYIAFWQDVCQ